MRHGSVLWVTQLEQLTNNFFPTQDGHILIPVLPRDWSTLLCLSLLLYVPVYAAMIRQENKTYAPLR